MSIRVTCSKCHTRFNVSEKFAGKEGPCPKCKHRIKIPAKSEEVVVHEPEVTGPKNAQGQAVLNPIRRKETRLGNGQIIGIVVSIAAFLICALVFNVIYEDPGTFPGYLLWVSAIAMAPPICFAAYFMLRDQELGGYSGSELRNRVLVCSAIYALLWIAMPVAKYAFSDSYETGSWIMALVIMGGAGAAAGMLSFDLDYLMGLVHYGLYLGLCLLGRLIAGIGALPGSIEAPTPDAPTAESVALAIESISPWLNDIATIVT